MYVYEKTPAEIYRQSFATIVAEAQLSRFGNEERNIVIRMIHACGMVDLADDVVISPGAVNAGRDALAKGAAIICDVEMVQRGIIARKLPADNRLLCNVRSEQADVLAKEKSTTRSAGGIESFTEQIQGSIVVVGNAPTALFHLLEMIESGVAAPALIVGCPVGFVGAVESKEALIAFGRDIPFISVRGRRGGSAMAASVVNALAGGLS